MNAVAAYFRKTLGWRGWAVFLYNAFIENIFLVFYILLANRQFETVYLVDLLVFYLFSIFSTSYGFLVNDLGDRELDARHGKSNTFDGDSQGAAVFMVVATLATSAVFAWRFVEQSWFVGLWAAWVFTATAYSLPPFRLKEKGTLGLINVVAAQRLIPALLVYTVFNPVATVDLVLFTLYIWARGFASDIAHQLADYENDRETDTRTFAVSSGERRARRIFHIVLESEKVLLLAVLFRMVVMAVETPLLTYQVLWLLLLIALPAYAYNLVQLRGGADRNPFLHGERNVFQFLHHAFPSVVMPMVLLLILCRFNPLYLLLVAVLAWNKGLFRREILLESYPVRLVRNLLAGGR